MIGSLGHPEGRYTTSRSEGAGDTKKRKKSEGEWTFAYEWVERESQSGLTQAGVHASRHKWSEGEERRNRKGKGSKRLIVSPYKQRGRG